MNTNAGVISMGGYLPAKEVSADRIERLVSFLEKETLLHPEYIKVIKDTKKMPGKIETNYDGWESQPWFNAWLEKLSPKKRENPFQGTKERRIVPMDPESIKKSIHPHLMLSSDAETLAGAFAITNAGINKDEIDLVLCNSLVPDKGVPLNGSLVQHKLKLKNAGAYNIDACCASFVTMLEIAMTYVRSGVKKNVLVVASALNSHINDKSTYFSVDIGDAAVAAIVSKVEDGYGYISSHSTSHGDRYAAITFEKRKPEMLMTTSHGPNYEQDFVTFFDMEQCKVIAENAQKDMAEVAAKSLGKAGLKVNDVDFLLTHQPVSWAANAWREAIGVPKEKFYESFEKYGNIACTAAAVNMLEAIEKGLIKEGYNVMIASSGVGESHIAVLHKVPSLLIENVRL